MEENKFGGVLHKMKVILNRSIWWWWQSNVVSFALCCHLKFNRLFAEPIHGKHEQAPELKWLCPEILKWEMHTNPSKGTTLAWYSHNFPAHEAREFYKPSEEAESLLGWIG